MHDSARLALYRKTKAKFLASASDAPSFLAPPPPQHPEPFVPLGLRPLPDANSDDLVPFEESDG